MPTHNWRKKGGREREREQLGHLGRRIKQSPGPLREREKKESWEGGLLPRASPRAEANRIGPHEGLSSALGLFWGHEFKRDGSIFLLLLSPCLN